MTHSPLDRRFAKDVAKRLDRRRMRRRLLGSAALVAALALAASYLTCGGGWGLGGKGKGSGAGPGGGSGAGSGGEVRPLLAAVVDAGPRRCELRVAASGISVDGRPATVAEAVDACRAATAAEVLVTGGARQADWEALEAALRGASIQILRVEPRGDGAAGSAASADPRRPEAADRPATGDGAVPAGAPATGDGAAAGAPPTSDGAAAASAPPAGAPAPATATDDAATGAPPAGSTATAPPPHRPLAP